MAAAVALTDSVGQAAGVIERSHGLWYVDQTDEYVIPWLCAACGSVSRCSLRVSAILGLIRREVEVMLMASVGDW